MNKKKIISTVAIIAILLVGVVGFLGWKGKEKTNSMLQEQVQRINTDNEDIDEQKALALLPKELFHYDLQKNGFNQDKSLYSVNVYSSLKTDARLKEARVPEQDFQKYAGCWIINLRNKAVYRIATATGQDYNFYQWVGNDKVELIGDGKKTATTYNALTGYVVSTRTFNLDNSVDISNWKIYQNSEENFEIKYPIGVVIQEKNENFIDDSVNRYVSFYDPKTEATIYLGVKQKSESNIMPKPYRTGIPGGDFLNRGTVAFGNGLAQEIRLVNCDFPGENHCTVELMWFCAPGDFGSNNFDLGSDTSAFMEVDLAEKSNVNDVTKLVHGMIRSFRAL